VCFTVKADTMQFGPGDCFDGVVGNSLSDLGLWIVFFEEIALLVPERCSKHRVEPGILDLFLRQDVSRPVGCTEHFRHLKIEDDLGGFFEVWQLAARHPDRRTDVVEPSGRHRAGLVNQALGFERRGKGRPGDHRISEQRRKHRPGYSAHIEYTYRACDPHLDQADAGAERIQRIAGNAVLWLPDRQPAVLVELYRDGSAQLRRHFCLHVEANNRPAVFG
jgi:hypothetical protein